MLTRVKHSLKMAARRNVMAILRVACRDIMKEHSTGHTECFYEKMISQFLYERDIPFITQTDCFVQTACAQVLVGRIDMEIDHSTVVELKVGTCVRRADMQQLMKYVRAKRASGIRVTHAVVICFRTDGRVQFQEVELDSVLSNEKSLVPYSEMQRPLCRTRRLLSSCFSA